MKSTVNQWVQSFFKRTMISAYWAPRESYCWKKIKNILTNLSSIWSNASLKWHQNYNNQSFFLAKYDVFRSKQQYSKYLLTEIQNNIKKTKKSRSKILYIKPITCYLVKKSEKPERCFKNKKIWVVCETWQSFSDSIRWGAV